MDGKQETSVGTITSLDGTRTITVEEFDQLFDDASDEIDQFIDWKSAIWDGTSRVYRIGRKNDADDSTLSRHEIPKDAAE